MCTVCIVKLYFFLLLCGFILQNILIFPECCISSIFLFVIVWYNSIFLCSVSCDSAADGQRERFLRATGCGQLTANEAQVLLVVDSALAYCWVSFSLCQRLPDESLRAKLVWMAWWVFLFLILNCQAGDFFFPSHNFMWKSDLCIRLIGRFFCSLPRANKCIILSRCRYACQWISSVLFFFCPHLHLLTHIINNHSWQISKRQETNDANDSKNLKDKFWINYHPWKSTLFLTVTKYPFWSYHSALV